MTKRRSPGCSVQRSPSDSGVYPAAVRRAAVLAMAWKQVGLAEIKSSMGRAEAGVVVIVNNLLVLEQWTT